MRYPERQAQQDASDQARYGRQADMRPGARLRVRGALGRGRGPEVLGTAVLTRVGADGDEALVPTREYGRRWFVNKSGHAFVVVEELG